MPETATNAVALDATAVFVQTIGRTHVDRSVAKMIAIHDEDMRQVPSLSVKSCWWHASYC